MDNQQASLTQIQTDRLISSSIELIGAFSDAYGPEQGIALWEQFGVVLGDEVKHNVFMAMLNGQTSGVVTLYPSKDLRDRGVMVPVIKCIRHYAGHGLQAAKCITDAIVDGGTKQIDVRHTERHLALQELRSLGVVCS